MARVHADCLGGVSSACPEARSLGDGCVCRGFDYVFWLAHDCCLVASVSSLCIRFGIFATVSMRSRLDGCRVRYAMRSRSLRRIQVLCTITSFIPRVVVIRWTLLQGSPRLRQPRRCALTSSDICSGPAEAEVCGRTVPSQLVNLVQLDWEAMRSDMSSSSSPAPASGLLVSAMGI